MITVMAGMVLLDPYGAEYLVTEVDDLAGIVIAQPYGNDCAEQWQLERTERALAAGRFTALAGGASYGDGAGSEVWA